MSNWGDRAEKRTCQNEKCRKEFYPDVHNQEYCSEKCKQAAENRRHYQAHRAEMIERVKKSKRKGK